MERTRRDLLAALGTTVAGGLAGCGGRGPLPGDGDGGSATDTPAGDRWVDRSLPAPMARVTMAPHEPRSRRERRVRVAWDDTAGAVHVTGHMVYGSSSCNRPGVANVSYDPERDRLDLRLAPADPGNVGGCTMDVADARYRVTVTFEGDLPGTVHVVEEHHPDAVDAERTVERAAQRERCATDTPGGTPTTGTPTGTPPGTIPPTCPETYVDGRRGDATLTTDGTTSARTTTVGTTAATGSPDD